LGRRKGSKKLGIGSMIPNWKKFAGKLELVSMIFKYSKLKKEAARKIRNWDV
jgi:hypothetical protein